MPYNQFHSELNPKPTPPQKSSTKKQNHTKRNKRINRRLPYESIYLWDFRATVDTIFIDELFSV